MELIQAGENTYYLKNPTNIGIYKVEDNGVYIIDTGNDKEAGKKILKIIEEQGWHILGIINTHSHADHIGGNKVIQDRTNSPIFGYNIEKCFTEFPLLEPSFLYGAYPFKDLQNKFLLAKESTVTNIQNNLPKSLEYFPIRGHYFDMIGIKTADDIYFLGDSLFSEETINKYHVFFIYNVREYINTLDYLETLKGKLFIPSHTPATTDISSLIKLNRDKIRDVCTTIISLCQNPLTFEDLLTKIFETYNLTMNLNQYYLIGCTVKAYLSYLYDEDKLLYEFKDNKMYWRTKA